MNLKENERMNVVQFVVETDAVHFFFVVGASRFEGTGVQLIRRRNMSSEEQTQQQVPIPDWSHLVGQHINSASAHISATHPHLHIQTVAPGALVTRDYRQDRVRLYHDDQGTVTSKPNVG